MEQELAPFLSQYEGVCSQVASLAEQLRMLTRKYEHVEENKRLQILKNKTFKEVREEAQKLECNGIDAYRQASDRHSSLVNSRKLPLEPLPELLYAMACFRDSAALYRSASTLTAHKEANEQLEKASRCDGFQALTIYASGKTMRLRQSSQDRPYFQFCISCKRSFPPQKEGVTEGENCFFCTKMQLARDLAKNAFENCPSHSISVIVFCLSSWQLWESPELQNVPKEVKDLVSSYAFRRADRLCCWYDKERQDDLERSRHFIVNEQLSFEPLPTSTLQDVVSVETIRKNLHTLLKSPVDERCAKHGIQLFVNYLSSEERKSKSKSIQLMLQRSSRKQMCPLCLEVQKDGGKNSHIMSNGLLNLSGKRVLNSYYYHNGNYPAAWVFNPDKMTENLFCEECELHFSKAGENSGIELFKNVLEEMQENRVPKKTREEVESLLDEEDEKKILEEDDSKRIEKNIPGEDRVISPLFHMLCQQGYRHLVVFGTCTQVATTIKEDFYKLFQLLSVIVHRLRTAEEVKAAAAEILIQYVPMPFVWAVKKEERYTYLTTFYDFESKKAIVHICIQDLHFCIATKDECATKEECTSNISAFSVIEPDSRGLCLPNFCTTVALYKKNPLLTLMNERFSDSLQCFSQSIDLSKVKRNQKQPFPALELLITLDFPRARRLEGPVVRLGKSFVYSPPKHSIRKYGWITPVAGYKFAHIHDVFCKNVSARMTVGWHTFRKKVFVIFDLLPPNDVLTTPPQWLPRLVYGFWLSFSHSKGLELTAIGNHDGLFVGYEGWGLDSDEPKAYIKLMVQSNFWKIRTSHRDFYRPPSIVTELFGKLENLERNSTCHYPFVTVSQAQIDGATAQHYELEARLYELRILEK